MRRKATWSGIGSILLLGLVGWSLLAGVQEERQEVYLGHPSSIAGVTLKPGKYLVVHKPQVMDHEGEACTYFYRLPYRSDTEPIAKARCTPTPGAQVNEFTLKSTHQPDGTSVLKSIQFPGSAEVHTFGAGS